MSDFWDAISATGFTENGAVTNTTSGSAVLDLFAMGGSMRGQKDRALKLFGKALAEDEDLALKCLFYLRDVRGGQGERQIFRDIIAEYGLSDRLMKLVPEYGRWDDLFVLPAPEYVYILKQQLESDIMSDHPSLLAKWMPSENASSPKTKALAKEIREAMGGRPREYRKMLSTIRAKLNLVETSLSKRETGSIQYPHVPSRAMMKYRKAFLRNDETRFRTFLSKVDSGEDKMNTGTLFPHEIVAKCRPSWYRLDKVDPAMETAWKALPDYTRGQRGICVADTSVSMSGTPMDMSLALSMYFAERNESIFKGKFITFSGRPTLQSIEGSTIAEKYSNFVKAKWNMNTDLQKVFDLILSSGVQHGLTDEQMPDIIYIISDMEFDSCVQFKTNYQVIDEKYKQAGYKRPTICFWNVDSRNDNVAVKKDDPNVTLVSGASPSTFSRAMSGMSPYEFMLETLNSDRYKPITK